MKHKFADALQTFLSYTIVITAAILLLLVVSQPKPSVVEAPVVSNEGTITTEPALVAGVLDEQPITSYILNEINEVRASDELSVLKYDDRLSVSACKKLADFVNENDYKHDYRDGRPWYADFDPMFYNRGEILGWKFQGDILINAWVNSPKHKQVMMNPAYTHFGICHKGNYTAVHFGSIK